MIERLLPIVVILIAGALFFGYINPTYTGTIAEIHAEIAGYDKALEAAKSFSEKEKKLSEERNAIPPEDIARLEAFLPDGVDNVQLILDLDALATRSGVKLSGFEMDVQKIGAPDSSMGELPLENSLVETLTLGVTATGTYEAFRTFLLGVENSLRPLDLISLDIQDSTTGVYSYDMIFSIYWLK